MEALLYALQRLLTCNQDRLDLVVVVVIIGEPIVVSISDVTVSGRQYG